MKLVAWSAVGSFSPGVFVHVMDCRAQAISVEKSLSAKYCDASTPPGRMDQAVSVLASGTLAVIEGLRK